MGLVMRWLVGASVLALGVLSAVPAFAWGKEGHEVVVRLAATRLTPAAQAGIKDLLDNTDATDALVRYASWADEVAYNGRDYSKHWHYVDIQITETGYDKARDCKDDDCSVEQIGKEVAIIKDKTQSRTARVDALKFLIHFVGDMHQPMHCSDNNNRGANEIKISGMGRKANMHKVWDTAVVNAIGKDGVEIAGKLAPLITPDLEVLWGRGTPEEWTNECFAVAKHVYQTTPGMIDAKTAIDLDPNYVVTVGPITVEQLAKAGVRLAYLLNQAFPANDNTPADAKPTETPAVK